MSDACVDTGRRVYTELDVAQKKALKGWVRGGRLLALTVVPCPHGIPQHYHLVPVNEELIKPVMDEGELARVIQPTNDLHDVRAAGRRKYPPGFEFVVECYVPTEVAKNGRAFYWGRAGRDWTTVCVAAADVERVEEGD